MSSEALKNVLKLSMSVDEANEVAQSMLIDNGESRRRELYEFVDEYLKLPKIVGDVCAFHNFATTLAQNDEYALACDVLQRGLNCFPDNAELTADYLKYDHACAKTDKCKLKSQTYYTLKARNEFRYCNYDKSLFDIQKAMTFSDDKQLTSNDGYLHFMSGICKIAFSEQNNIDLDKKSVLDIYRDFDVAAAIANDTAVNYKDMVKRKVNYLSEKYNVSVPKKNKDLLMCIDETDKN